MVQHGCKRWFSATPCSWCQPSTHPQASSSMRCPAVGKTGSGHQRPGAAPVCNSLRWHTTQTRLQRDPGKLGQVRGRGPGKDLGVAHWDGKMVYVTQMGALAGPAELYQASLPPSAPLASPSIPAPTSMKPSLLLTPDSFPPLASLSQADWGNRWVPSTYSSLWLP
jgi:hypothetical protein